MRGFPGNDERRSKDSARSRGILTVAAAFPCDLNYTRLLCFVEAQRKQLALCTILLYNFIMILFLFISNFIINAGVFPIEAPITELDDFFNLKYLWINSKSLTNNR